VANALDRVQHVAAAHGPQWISRILDPKPA
jgi:hypothetical protein